MSETKALLDRLGVVPSRALGQNFLTDSASAKAIVTELRVREGDTVIEVGPGTGALSEHLVGLGRRLVLIEFDRKLAAHLTQRFADTPDVEVIEADATEFDLRPYYAEAPLKVIGNLPYSCGGEIMKNFLDPPSPVEAAVFMLQKEVGGRLSAQPKSKAYGNLTLMIRSAWNVEPLQCLSPEPFYPQPAVDSAVVRLTRRIDGDPAPYDRRTFERLVRSGFSQRRKQLKKRLPLEEFDWDTVCKRLGFTETARAEELSLDDWLALTRLVDPHPLKDNPQSGEELFDVVDDDDQVIGQKPRAQVHAEGLKHRAVHMFVFNRKGELFLQKRSMLKDSAPGKWDSSASGHLDVGEDYAVAAVRELGEELGIEAEVEQIAALSPCANTGWEFVRVFRSEHRGPFRWPCSEIETGCFFSSEVIEQWIARRPEDFATGFVECWKAYCGTQAP